jgi:hypothetical protein
LVDFSTYSAAPRYRGSSFLAADRGEKFEDRFGRLAAMMLRALERRRDRAHGRAAAFQPTILGREPVGGEVTERDRWQEMERYYGRAYDAVHAAGVYVHHAAVRLQRIRDDARDRG